MSDISATDSDVSARPTLLLVDDEDSILSSLKRLLRREAYQVITANGGQAGLDELARNRIDVIVSDQRMPGMSGVEFLRQAKERYPDTVRIVLSGYADLQSITDAINEGAIYKFLSKPWDDDTLKAEIDEAFHRKALRDENKHLGQLVQEANEELIRLNARLEDALVEQRQRTETSETALTAVQDIVNCLPLPLLGVDPDGLVAFANAEATRCFVRTPLLGAFVAEALPPAAGKLLVQGEGDAMVTIEENSYRLSCHAVESTMFQHGYLLVFIPDKAS